MMMRQATTFDRLSTLSTHLRRGAMTVALGLSSAAGAMGAPMTSSVQFSLDPEPLATFDTTQGTLLGVEISLDAMLRAYNPFTDSPTRHDGLCHATFSDGSLGVGAPGTPTLFTLDFGGTARNPCDTFEFDVIKLGSTSVDSSFFSAFTSVGPSAITLILTKIAGTVSVTDGTETRASSGSWLGGGRVTYTYCPPGQDCGATLPVPEPATALLVTLGLASLFAYQRFRLPH